MKEKYLQDEIFNGEDFVENPLRQGEYENCVFNNCNFFENLLSGFTFVDCEFNKFKDRGLLKYRVLLENVYL